MKEDELEKLVGFVESVMADGGSFVEGMQVAATAVLDDGLERIAAVLQGVHDNYDTDLMRALIEAEVERWADDFRHGRRAYDLADPELVVERAFRNMARYGPLTDLLADDDVWEVQVNAPSSVFVRRHQGLSGYHDEVFHDDAHVLRTLTKLLDDAASVLPVHDVSHPGIVLGAELAAGAEMTGRRMAVLGALAAALGLLIWGLTQRHWYLVEMGALFVGLTVVMAAIGRLGIDRTAATFGRGAAELTTTALMIGVARAIQVVLDRGGVVDTIVHGISLPLQALPSGLAAVGMLVVQSVTNLFIPSGSGQAYVTMPIMAPLADLLGLTRQTAGESILVKIIGDFGSR